MGAPHMQHPTRWRGTAVLAACTATLLLSACKTMPEAGKKLSEMTGMGPSVRAGVLPPPPAARSWPDAAADVRNQRARGYGLVEMPQMQAYLTGLLQSIKQASGVPDWPGAVYITAATDLDAYCTGAGNVYVSLAWLQSMESEDEMVALLAHEWGHVFMDSHKLEGAITTSDDMAKWAAIGVGLARKVGNATGWTPVDSMVAAYSIGKGTLAPAWGRSDESDADTFGVTVSMQLGYSFPSGYKAFLERMASWEAENSQRRETERLALLEQLQRASAQQLRQKNANMKGPAAAGLLDLNVALNGGVIELGESFKGGVNDLLKQVQQGHPDVDKRLSSLVEQVQPLMAGKPRPAARTEPWQRALAQPQTAAILANYQHVADARAALQQQDFRAARQLALQAASEPTAQHALPMLVLDMTEGYAVATPVRSTGGKTNAAKELRPLERNLQSEPHRAWRIYMTQANKLLGSGQTQQARAVLVEGFGYFEKAPAVWPDVIAFVGRTENWDKAKQLAQTCGQRFASSAELCRQAAQSPQEIAQAQKLSDSKAEKLVNKWFKK